MADVMARFNLHDYRREQLETDFEPTRSGTNSQGAPVATRLDRFYLPTHADFDSTLWDIHVCPTLVWSKENSDHLPVVLTIEPSVGERGHERETIREELVFKPDIQEKILAALSKAYEGTSSLNKKWSRANNMIRHLLLTETAKLKKKEKIEAKATRVRLIVVTKAIAEDPSVPLIAEQKKLKAELFALENPEAPHLASAARAKSMSDRSEACTLPFFRTHKAVSKQQWINSVHEASWEEGTEPTITGKVTDPSKVAEELCKYYEMLFSKKKTSPRAKRTVLSHLRERRIQQASADELERPIEDEEVQAVMEHLPLGKQAGPNRVPNAVYRCLSKAFARKLAAILRAAVGGGALPDYASTGRPLRRHALERCGPVPEEGRQAR